MMPGLLPQTVFRLPFLVTRDRVFNMCKTHTRRYDVIEEFNMD